NSRATASRSGRAPQVTANWLTSATIAAQAASLIAAGAGKSGKPCDRLTPPYKSLSRVISRMTDSVNWVAFFDPVSFDMRCSNTKGAKDTKEFEGFLGVPGALGVDL